MAETSQQLPLFAARFPVRLCANVLRRESLRRLRVYGASTVPSFAIGHLADTAARLDLLQAGAARTVTIRQGRRSARTLALFAGTREGRQLLRRVERLRDQVATMEAGLRAERMRQGCA